MIPEEKGKKQESKWEHEAEVRRIFIWTSQHAEILREDSATIRSGAFSVRESVLDEPEEMR